MAKGQKSFLMAENLPSDGVAYTDQSTASGQDLSGRCKHAIHITQQKVSILIYMF